MFDSSLTRVIWEQQTIHDTLLTSLQWHESCLRRLWSLNLFRISEISPPHFHIKKIWLQITDFFLNLWFFRNTFTSKTACLLISEFCPNLWITISMIFHGNKFLLYISELCLNLWITIVRYNIKILDTKNLCFIPNNWKNCCNLSLFLLLVVTEYFSESLQYHCNKKIFLSSLIYNYC